MITNQTFEANSLAPGRSYSIKTVLKKHISKKRKCPLFGIPNHSFHIFECWTIDVMFIGGFCRCCVCFSLSSSFSFVSPAGVIVYFGAIFLFKLNNVLHKCQNVGILIQCGGSQQLDRMIELKSFLRHSFSFLFNAAPLRMSCSFSVSALLYITLVRSWNYINQTHEARATSFQWIGIQKIIKPNTIRIGIDLHCERCGSRYVQCNSYSRLRDASVRAVSCSVHYNEWRDTNVKCSSDFRFRMIRPKWGIQIQPNCTQS